VSAATIEAAEQLGLLLARLRRCKMALAVGPELGELSLDLGRQVYCVRGGCDGRDRRARIGVVGVHSGADHEAAVGLALGEGVPRDDGGVRHGLEAAEGRRYRRRIVGEVGR